MQTPCLLLPALLLAAPALAQTAAPAPADTAHFYQHHLGLTASPQLDHFFTANRALPVGLLYKYQNKPHALWRFGLTLNQNYSRQDEYKPDFSPINLKNNPEYTNSLFGVGISLGREHTHQFARRWMGTAGADLSVGFSQYKSKRSYQSLGNPILGTPSTEITDGFRQRYYKVSFSPFIGLRFYPWLQLYISAESAIQLAYLRETVNNLAFSTNLQTGQMLAGSTDFTEQQLRIQSTLLHYYLLNQLTIHYLLDK